MNPDLHKLSEYEHEAIFQELIKPHIFHKATPNDRPTVVVFGGQPGAGKSAAVDQAKHELDARGGCVEIIGDDLRLYHPAYDALMRADDQTAAFFTDKDSGRWVQKSIEYARSIKVNTVIEGTFRSADVVSKTMRDFKAAGYVVDARVLAVNAQFSEQGILQRYEAQKADRGSGRMTTREAHQAAYEGLPKTLAVVEQQKLADSVMVFKRGAELLYSNELVKGEWRDPPAAVAAVEAERNRPLTLDEKARLATGYSKVHEMAQARTAPAEQLDRISELESAAVNNHKAAVFRELPASEAVKKYPDLAQAYSALKFITEAKPATTHPAFVEQVKNGLAAAIEEGRAVPHPEPQPDRAPVPIKPKGHER